MLLTAGGIAAVIAGAAYLLRPRRRRARRDGDLTRTVRLRREPMGELVHEDRAGSFARRHR